MAHVERNYKILEQKMIDQMEMSLDFGRTILEKELDAGILNFVVKPIVRSFYKYWADKDATEGTLGQIKIALDSAKELVQNGDTTDQKFNEVINRNFPIYLQSDQTDRQCKENHKNYPRLKEITKQLFIAQVEESILFLNVTEEIHNYSELSRVTFETKERAYQALKRQLDFNEAGIEVVEQDNNILKVIAGRDIIVKVLRNGFEMTKQALLDELDTIFN